MSAALAQPPQREQIPAAGLLLLTVRRWSTRKQKNAIFFFFFASPPLSCRCMYLYICMPNGERGNERAASKNEEEEEVGRWGGDVDTYETGQVV
ncbi:hypothetical protein C4D60_Mb08t03450 [Musa balbisiana]|uniref:Uncharacterized protein n=1 Tax=Musa balbisiana TaxID=52838 RepID=A0A4V4H8P0_MUSBA|nr:hypothetical protein C4D60_Mb08t03450 [Musa balbisiana]